MSATQSEPAASEIESATDAAIATCDDDARAAVAALIVANGFLEVEVERLRQATSFGYVKGRLLDHSDAKASGPFRRAIKGVGDG